MYHQKQHRTWTHNMIVGFHQQRIIWLLRWNQISNATPGYLQEMMQVKVRWSQCSLWLPEGHESENIPVFIYMHTTLMAIYNFHTNASRFGLICFFYKIIKWPHAGKGKLRIKSIFHNHIILSSTLLTTTLNYVISYRYFYLPNEQMQVIHYDKIKYFTSCYFE